MGDWNRYEATLRDRRENLDFTVYVMGVTIGTALDKLTGEYPHARYRVLKMEQTLNDPLSNPNSFKGAKGPNDT